jgi:predicted small lipoprotein YifL
MEKPGMPNELMTAPRYWRTEVWRQAPIERVTSMKRVISCTAILILLCSLMGCGKTTPKREPVAAGPPPALQQGAKIRVVDVSNDTEELFDVDVIGLLWNGLARSLAKRNLLWDATAAASPPISLTAHILKFQKGSVFMRPVLPMWGKTVLTVRVDLKEGDQVIGSVEREEVVSYGNGVFTIDACRKIFSTMSDALVQEIDKKL